MNYALNLAEDGRILSATYERYAGADAVLVECLPEGDIADYIYRDGIFAFDPLPKPEKSDEVVSAQYDMEAMLVDLEYRLTLLELERAE